MTMDSEYSKQCNDFQHELEEAKLRLISLNENIRRIVGRTANARSEKTKLSDLKRSEPGRKCSDVPKPKKRVYEQKSVFNRLSVPAFKNKSDEQEPRPRVTSRIIRELPTRQEIVAAQCNDSESRARNKRMFGSLLGTLHKFTQEESRLKQKEEKKAQIEKKLEEQEIQEKEILKKEREHLFMDRKRKQIEIKKLELKVNRLKDFETAEATSNFLKHHIRTKTKPHIYFLPKLMSKNTEQILLDSRATLEIFTNKQRKLLNKDLADIENCLKDTDLDTEENPESVETNFEKNIQHGDEKNVFFEERIKECDIKNLKRKLEKDLDTKENLSEPVVSSSVVVVKNEQID